MVDPRTERASKPASVTLLDLVNDLDWCILQVLQIEVPDTDEARKKAVEGLSSLATVIRGYAEADFRLEPR